MKNHSSLSDSVVTVLFVEFHFVKFRERFTMPRAYAKIFFLLFQTQLKLLMFKTRVDIKQDVRVRR